jgi:hypothetical protein
MVEMSRSLPRDPMPNSPEILKQGRNGQLRTLVLTSQYLTSSLAAGRVNKRLKCPETTPINPVINVLEP